MQKIVASILMSCAFYAARGMEANKITSVKITSHNRQVSICVQADGNGKYEKIVAREKTDGGPAQVINREPSAETCETFLDNWALEHKKLVDVIEMLDSLDDYSC
jgi:hypothetical protein